MALHIYKQIKGNEGHELNCIFQSHFFSMILVSLLYHIIKMKIESSEWKNPKNDTYYKKHPKSLTVYVYTNV